jgi:hypothetical protein
MLTTMESLAAIAMPSIPVPPEFRIGLIILGIVCAILFVATMLMSNRTRAVARPKKMVLQMSGSPASIIAESTQDEEDVSVDLAEPSHAVAENRMSIGRLLGKIGHARDAHVDGSPKCDVADATIAVDTVNADHELEEINAEDDHAAFEQPVFTTDVEDEDEDFALSPIARVRRSIAKMLSMMSARFKTPSTTDSDLGDFDDGLEAQLAAAAESTGHLETPITEPPTHAVESVPRYLRHPSLADVPADRLRPYHLEDDAQSSQPVGVTIAPPVAGISEDAAAEPERPASTMPPRQRTERGSLNGFSSNGYGHEHDKPISRPMAPITAPDDEPFIDAEFVSAEGIAMRFDEPSATETHKAFHAPSMFSDANDDIDMDFEDVIDVAVNPVEITSVDLRNTQPYRDLDFAIAGDRESDRSAVDVVTPSPASEHHVPSSMTRPASIDPIDETPAQMIRHDDSLEKDAADDAGLPADAVAATNITSAHDLDVDAVIAQLAQDEQSGQLAAEQERQRVAEEEAAKAKQGPAMIQAVTWTRRYLGDDSPTMDHHERLRFARILRDLDDFEVAGRTLYDGLTEEPNPDVLVAMYESLVDAYNHDILMPAHQIFLDDKDPRMRDIAARAIADLERVPT